MSITFTKFILETEFTKKMPSFYLFFIGISFFLDKNRDRLIYRALDKSDLNIYPYQRTMYYKGYENGTDIISAKLFLRLAA